MKKLILFFLLVSSAMFAQTSLGSFTCSNVGGGVSWNNSNGNAVAHGQCRFTDRGNGHGSLRVTEETGVNLAGQLYSISIALPPPLQPQIVEESLVVDVISWPVGSAGILLTIDGINATGLETIGSAKATLNVPVGSPGYTIASKEFSIQRVFPVPIPASSFAFYHYSDGGGSSWYAVTYNITWEISW
jgi:hypothetical protein